MIPQGITVNGNMEGSGHLLIHGTVHGNVDLKGRLEIGKDGLVEGDLWADEVVVLGKIKGNVHSGSKIFLRAGCRIDGDLACGGLIVEEGAWLTGRCQMGRRETPGLQQEHRQGQPAHMPRREAAPRPGHSGLVSLAPGSRPGSTVSGASEKTGAAMGDRGTTPRA